MKLWDILEHLEDPKLSVALGTRTGGLGLSDSAGIACATLIEHLQSRAHSRIDRLVFYGYTLPEYAVTVDVVTRSFELPEGSVPQEVWEFVARNREEERQGK